MTARREENPLLSGFPGKLVLSIVCIRCFINKLVRNREGEGENKSDKACCVTIFRCVRAPHGNCTCSCFDLNRPQPLQPAARLWCMEFYADAGLKLNNLLFHPATMDRNLITENTISQRILRAHDESLFEDALCIL